ncbi:MAG: cellulase family glycosylhydrolase [Bacteroidetes bacterium]|nr:cellulase family glycosylhydrolase [Bacteroidota bacterium]
MLKIIITWLLLFSVLIAGEIPFKKGLNLYDWFQTSSAGQIQFSKYTKQDFINLKTMGCDHIRLPINLQYMTDGAPYYNIDEIFYNFLDKVVDWAEELQIHLILDNHTFDPALDTDPSVEAVLLSVWKQMADHYKDRSNLIYYEILNEPHGITDAEWNRIQLNIINAIREIDDRHTIIVGPAGWNSYNNLKFMPQYSDTNLIYTFHFYDPFLFTHQGASWTNPSLVPLHDVPFPYISSKMPQCPDQLKGTWIESSLNNYSNEGTIGNVKKLIDMAVAFQQERKVPIWCGEFGVYIPNSNNNDRILWHSIVRSYFEEKNIAWSLWGYSQGFGIFKEGSNELFDYDLNTKLVEALGFVIPPQKEFSINPDSSGFEIYNDFIGEKIFESSSSGTGLINFYSSLNPHNGLYCLDWSNAPQYNNIGFNFNPDRDLSFLVSQGYALDFWVKGNKTNVSFDIRFVDSKNDDPDDHPWRMRYTVNELLAPWDNQWHYVQLPLNKFTEHGSWDNNTWYNPAGKFDWKSVDRFEIVAEQQSLSGVKFSFDNIRLVDPSTVDNDYELIKVSNFVLNQNYPNPFNPSTIIEYSLPSGMYAKLVIYNSIGQKIRTLFDGFTNSGKYKVVWDGRDDSGLNVSCGIYLYQIISNNDMRSRKMMLLR